jgi:hypothetical protein
MFLGLDASDKVLLTGGSWIFMARVDEEKKDQIVKLLHILSDI